MPNSNSKTREAKPYNRKEGLGPISINFRINLKQIDRSRFSAADTAARTSIEECNPKLSRLGGSQLELEQIMTSQEVLEVADLEDDIFDWLQANENNRISFMTDPIGAIRSIGLKLTKGVLNRIGFQRKAFERISTNIPNAIINEARITVAKKIPRKRKVPKLAELLAARKPTPKTDHEAELAKLRAALENKKP